ncbi:MAG: BrnT family toxin [Pseudomonadota bacterium]
MGQRQGAGQPDQAWHRFPDSRAGFSRSHLIEFDDRDAKGELRFSAIGMVDGRVLFVSYTIRGAVIRIISARGAEPHEKRKYHEI